MRSTHPAINLLVRGALAASSPEHAAKLWQQVIDDKPLWQHAPSWILSVAFHDMRQREPSDEELGVMTVTSVCYPSSFACRKHSEIPCRSCNGSCVVVVERDGKPAHEPCHGCEGEGNSIVYHNECGCPTTAELLGEDLPSFNDKAK